MTKYDVDTYDTIKAKIVRDIKLYLKMYYDTETGLIKSLYKGKFTSFSYQDRILPHCSFDQFYTCGAHHDDHFGVRLTGVDGYGDNYGCNIKIPYDGVDEQELVSEFSALVVKNIEKINGSGIDKVRSLIN
jgi:hypothetical protein